MFDFLKKNNNRNNYYYPNQNPYNYQYNPGPNPLDPNMLDIEIRELKRLINDLNMRINRIEGYIGIRDDKPNGY